MRGSHANATEQGIVPLCGYPQIVCKIYFLFAFGVPLNFVRFLLLFALVLKLLQIMRTKSSAFL